MLSTIELQTLQVRLQRASESKTLINKQDVLHDYLLQVGSLNTVHENLFKEVAIKHGKIATLFKVNVYDLNELEADLHIEAAHHLLNTEIQRRSYDLAQYSKAESILFTPGTKFSKNQTLYTNARNESLSVEEMLRVAKYSIAFAEMMDPTDKNKEFASAAITVFQGIEATLNNQSQPIPISKKLHVANGFLSTVVKASIKDTDTKRGITIASTLIDLVIDFFVGR